VESAVQTTGCGSGTAMPRKIPDSPANVSGRAWQALLNDANPDLPDDPDAAGSRAHRPVRRAIKEFEVVNGEGVCAGVRLSTRTEE
jgi:hypothetical protein